jgi:hypothetical protein
MHILVTSVITKLRICAWHHTCICSGTSFFNHAVNPFYSPRMFAAPSVELPTHFFKSKPDFFKSSQTNLHKFSPVPEIHLTKPSNRSFTLVFTYRIITESWSWTFMSCVESICIEKNWASLISSDFPRIQNIIKSAQIFWNFNGPPGFAR